MGSTFCRGHKTGPHLDSLCPQGEGSNKPPPISYTAGCNHWNLYCINYLGYQGHCCYLSNMAAGFGPFSDYSINTNPFHPFGQCYCWHNGYNFDSIFLKTLDVFPRISGTSGNYWYPFFDNQINYFVNERRKKHDIYCKGLICPFL